MRSSCAVSACSLILLATSGQAATLKVPGTHATIGLAEAAASGGDAIKISKGRYQESVAENKFYDCQSGGISVDAESGGTATITKNRLEGLEQCGGDNTYGIYVGGNDASITKNGVHRLSDEFTHAIYAVGNRITASRNDISDIQDGTGVNVTGDDFTISGNNIRYGAHNCVGISTSGSALSNGSAVIERNSLYKLAAGTIDSGGDGVTLQRNDVKYAAQCGILVAGNNNRLTDNQMRQTGNDGFRISGDANRLTDCAAEGLDNGGTDTTASNCTLENSRIDCAGNSNMSSDAGAHYTTGGAWTVPEVD